MNVQNNINKDGKLFVRLVMNNAIVKITSKQAT